ncbi:DUF459 domain-containing protein [Pannonibacter carbonis]|uniref:SGNH/GDSL hydrolase family protein n=1 Tax=Pannonibacter carbonis TaxID=2067569 RepID=UPI000D0FB98A|nr:DUF459 domain-containing protein [Pannonibacter carbonis]
MILLCLGLALSGGPWGTSAFAQNGPITPPPSADGFNPFGPLLRLFGVTERERPVKEKPPAAVRPARQPSGPPAFTAAPKDDDAGIILIVGDGMAEGLAEGMAFILAQKPSVRVERLVEPKAGLLGTPPVAWADKVAARIAGGNVRAVVMMLGSSDVEVGSAPVEPTSGEAGIAGSAFGTPAWRETYRQRLGAVIQVVRRERKPFLVVSLPPVEAADLNQGFQVVNEVLKLTAEAARSTYVDIWSVFLDDNEAYAVFGPDVAGQRRRLRANDGIGFTWAGYRKVAFFVERELGRVLGGYGSQAFEGVADDPDFIVLTGRAVPAADALAGGPEVIDEFAPEPPVSVQAAQRFFILGEAPPSVPGRVDDTRLETR